MMEDIDIEVAVLARRAKISKADKDFFLEVCQIMDRKFAIEKSAYIAKTAEKIKKLEALLNGINETRRSKKKNP